MRGVLALRSRAPGYAVAQKCLDVQSAAEAKDPTLRSDKQTCLAPDARSWFIGAQGERHVGRLLGQLGPDWLVLHAVPIGAGTKDIDHLLIGPAGVFAINTKHHRGARVWVGDYVLRLNNINTTHLRAARSDAGEASRRLSAAAGYSVAVTAVLALVAEQSIVDSRHGSRSDPVVVSSSQLVRWLKTLPHRLSETEARHLRLVSEEPVTWHVDPSAANTLRVMQRFERLESDVYRRSEPTSVPRAVRSGSTPRRPAVAHRSGRSQRKVGPILVRLVVLFVALATMPAWLSGVVTLLQAGLTRALVP
jgi:hypothetical protein